MQKKIVTTTAAFPLGRPPQEKMFKVPSGQYAGRMIMIVHTASGEIKYTYADHPYNSWSALTSIASDAGDYSSDAVMDANGNVYLIFTNSSNNLVFRKLTFTAGTWSVGSAVTVYSSYPSTSPSVVIETNGDLWVGWTRDISSSLNISVKSSTDDGASWGTGPTDAGDALTSGSSAAFCKLVLNNDLLHVIYADGGTELSIRTRTISTEIWSSETNIDTGSGFDSNFDVALSSDGLLAVVYDIGALKYREYDGSNWGAIVQLDSNEAFSPQVMFIDKVPYAVYLTEPSAGQRLINFTSRIGGSFSAPAILDNSATQFDSVFLYDASAATFADRTTAASDTASADVTHPASSATVKDSGDQFYLGMDQRFRLIYFVLATAGIGGAATYSYWDGTIWRAFTPVGGNYALDSSGKDLVLWDDYLSLPSDWQKSVVDGQNRFWVRVEATAGYTTAPVASQITADSNIHSLSVRR